VFTRNERPQWDPALSGVPGSLDRLDAEREIDLLRSLDDLPDVVADAADALEPHRMTDALEELARRTHLWYHDHRILVDDEQLARARLALARASANALREGLALLGVEAPETM
jgi:arginyl-tRNA synthetase